MPLFSYKVINSVGETEEGIREAIDDKALISALQSEGYIPIKVTPANSGSFLGFGSKKSKLSPKDIGFFTGELLQSYDYPGDEIPFVSGSALLAFEAVSANPKIQKGENQWVDKIFALMQAVDDYIPTPAREVDKPFLMAIEDVFSITGRGTVSTGRIERGTVLLGDTVELVGLADTKTTTVTGLEMRLKDY